MVGLVDNGDAGGVGTAAGSGERERGRAVRQAELVHVVAADRLGLERSGQPVVHAAQPDIEQVNRFVVALRKEQHGRGGPEDHVPESEADGQPADAKLPRFEDDAQAVGGQCLDNPHLGWPKAEGLPAVGDPGVRARGIVQLDAPVDKVGRRAGTGQPQRCGVEPTVERGVALPARNRAAPNRAAPYPVKRCHRRFSPLPPRR